MHKHLNNFPSTHKKEEKLQMSNSSIQHTYVTDIYNYSVIRISGVCTGM